MRQGYEVGGESLSLFCADVLLYNIILGGVLYDERVKGLKEN